MAKIVASQLQSLVTRATITPTITPKVAPPQTAFGPFQCNTKRTAATIAIIVVTSIAFLFFCFYGLFGAGDLSPWPPSLSVMVKHHSREYYL